MVTADEVVSGAAAVVVVVVMANHSVLPRLFSVSFVNRSRDIIVRPESGPGGVGATGCSRPLRPASTAKSDLRHALSYLGTYGDG